MAQPKSSNAPQTPSKQKSRQSISIGGDVVNSQVVVGDNNNIYVTQSNQRPNIKRWPTPLLVGRPREAVNILDRESEREVVRNALDAKSPVEIYSAEGFGKTTLVSYLSSQMQLADGMVFLSSRAKSLDDIYFELFAAFYESDQLYRPSQVEYLRYFADLQALIVLDDVGLTREDVQVLLSALPACFFILSSAERHLWDQGDVIHLSGLPSEISVDLFKKRVGRALSDAEESLAEKICAALQNNPLHIIQAAAAVRDDGKSINALARELQAPSAEKALYDQILSGLPDSQKQALALLTVMGGAPLPETHMAKMLAPQNFSQLIGGLLQEGLALAHSPRYSIADGLRNYLMAAWDLAEWKNVSLQYFVNWTAGPVSQGQILDAADSIFAVLGNAAADGRWQELLRIGKAIESALLFSGQWGVWTRLLNLLLQASRALGDRFNEAWVLHQLGSRALCLRDLTLAKDLLSQALNIRLAIGDRIGLAVTQHNLNVLNGVIVPPKTGCRRFLNCGCGAVGLLVVAVLIVLVVINFGAVLPPSTPAPIPPSDTPTLTPSLTPSDTPTLTPSLTPTATLTPAPRAVYDFVANADQAKWFQKVIEGDGSLKFQPKPISNPSPEQYGPVFANSYVGWDYEVPMEDKSFEKMVLLTYPFGDLQSITGIYDLTQIPLEPGDYFSLRIGYKNILCKFCFLSDGVRFKILFSTDISGPATVIYDQIHFYYGKVITDYVPIPKGIQNRSVWFILELDSLKTSQGDYAAWANVVLMRP